MEIKLFEEGREPGVYMTTSRGVLRGSSNDKDIFSDKGKKHSVYLISQIDTMDCDKQEASVILGIEAIQ
jgi:hypothetical protein